TGSIFDTARPGVEVIVDRCAGVLEPGAILLLHDGDGSGEGGDRSQTVEALPQILQTARERGLEPVTVTELAEALRPRRNTVPRAAGEEPVDVGMRDVVPAIFIGFLLNTVLFARLGEVARVSVVRRRLAARGHPLPASPVVGTLVTEQLLSGATLVAVLIGVVIYVPVPRAAVNLLAVLSGVVIFIGLVAAAIEVWARLRRRRAPTDDYVERWWHLLGISFTSVVQGMRRGQAIFQRPKLLTVGLVTATSSWLAQMAGIYLTLAAYDIHKSLGVAAVVFLASNLVQLFPITPGNLGVFQGA